MDVLKFQPVIEKVLASMRIKRGQKEDMTQECYVALLENQANISGDDDTESATRICRTRVMEILRTETQLGTPKETQIRFVSADVPSVANRLAKIEISTEGKISESELYAAVDSLNDEDREVIQARFIEGLTQQQSCGKLNLTLKALKWRQARGVAALKKYFEAD